MFIKSFILGYMVIGGLMSIFGGEEAQEVTVEDTKPATVIEEKVEEKEQAKEIEDVPFEYKQALKKAQSYVDHNEFSEKDLRNQLEYHEFSQEAITYALENVVIDYQQECIDKAKSYLEHNSFSEQDLRNQLEYHEFNAEHIEKAIQETYK